MEDEPAYDIAVSVDCRLSPVDQRQSAIDGLLREAIEAALRRHRTPAARISLALVDDCRMAHLNEFHLKREGPTDVLAFDLRDSSPADQGMGPGEPVDGEIVVSVDTAVREAQERGHGLDAELALYAVHGTLHLLGYDDQSEHDGARMHEIEDEILSAIGLGPVYRGAIG